MSKNRKHRASSPKPEVDVVVTTAGRFDLLKTCLEALDSQDSNFSLSIIDNASDAEQRIANQGLFDDRNTKRLQQNIGFPAASNEGARMGSAPLILFLSDDVVLQEGTLEKLVRRMDDQTIGICGAKLLFPPTSTSPIRPAGKVQHVGLAVNIRGEIIHPLVGWSPENPRTQVSRDVFAVTGACFMIRRNLFSKANGFDVRYGKGTYEDVHLSCFVRSIGFRVFIDTDALAHHYVGATVEKRQESFPLQNNGLIFKSQWMHTPFMKWDEYRFYEGKPVVETEREVA